MPDGMVLGRGPRQTLWIITSATLEVPTLYYCPQNDHLLSCQGAAEDISLIHCEEEHGKDQPVVYNTRDLGWGTIPALSKTSTVNLHKRHSPPMFCMHHANNSSSYLSGVGEDNHTYRGGVWGCIRYVNIDA